MKRKKTGFNSTTFKVATAAAVVFLATVAAVSYFKINKAPSTLERAMDDLSVDGDPASLQQFALEKLRAGVNDDATKEAIYLISHRFFDNGGDIHEIVNFIDSHDEVAFLREAEGREPAVFQRIKNNQVTKYDVDSIRALLAYYEVAMEKGYANFSMLSTGVGKYTEYALILRGQSSTYGKEGTTPDEKEQLANTFIEKSKKFLTATEEYLDAQTEGTYDLSKLEEKGLIPDDIVVGLNQYASAQAYYRELKENVTPKIPMDLVFKFSSDYSRKSVPRLYFFTNYSWAVAEIHNGTFNATSVATPLDLVIEYGKANIESENPRRSLWRMLNSKVNQESGLFSPNYVKLLANKYEPFKTWIKENGWTDADFQ